MTEALSINPVWVQVLKDVMNGRTIAPRGKVTYELPQKSIVVDMRRPVLLAPERKLSYKFMAAEAYWILSGDDSVLGIAPWNNKIADFSDDGMRFFGAYGPKIVGQLDYVLNKLTADPDTRQAGLTIWRENPPLTKDVPCTVAIFAQIRDDKLNLHVFMRSSDVWLGLPYDVFNFSMLAHVICARLWLKSGFGVIDPLKVSPGTLYLTAASMHLYATNIEDALLAANAPVIAIDRRTPEVLYMDPTVLSTALMTIRDNDKSHASRWWNVPS